MSAALPRAFVVGWPIRHSRSPLIHGHWLAVHGLEGSYSALAVPPDALETFLRAFPRDGFVGGNVTVPHKEAAHAAAGRRTGAADAVGAANTLWLEDGVLCADNTDVEGFLANLDERAPGWDSRLDRTVVLGAGGSARAVVAALVHRGARRVVVVNRTLDRVKALTDRFGPRVEGAGWEAREAALAGADLLVNTTTLGMTGDGPLVLDITAMPSRAVVCDIVYVPLETPLLADARRAGLQGVDGLGMLLHQAVSGFARWFGVRPRVTPDLRALIEADLAGPTPLQAAT